MIMISDDGSDETGAAAFVMDLHSGAVGKSKLDGIGNV